MTGAPSAHDRKDGALALSGITRRFGDYTAVDDVSFEVGRGELLALVGASGSGKTTTLRIAAGYEAPDAGRVTLGGVDITAVPPERRGFGMVFQHYALFPHMPVAHNVAFGLEARGVNKTERLEKARQARSGFARCGAVRRDVDETQWRNLAVDRTGQSGRTIVRIDRAHRTCAPARDDREHQRGREAQSQAAETSGE